MEDNYKSNQNESSNRGNYIKRGRGGYNKGFNNHQQNQTGFQNYYSTPNQMDSYSTQMLIYRAEMYILMKYPYLIDLNMKNNECSKTVTDSSFFYVIKSFSEEDVHKAIKYNVWSSTKSGNQTLNNSYKLAKNQGGEVYLFFSTNGSGRFVGIAKMKSEVDFDKMFMYWTQDSKWGGIMNLEWVFIKDIPFREFRDIVILMKDGERKPVSNSRDTQEIPLEEGRKMISIFEKYLNTNTILEHFEYYDIRQENYEKNVNSQSQQN